MIFRVYLAFTLLTSVACHTSHPSVTNVPTPANDVIFSQLPLYSNEPNACTPAEPSGPWHGVLIAAPSVVMLPATGAALTAHICGRYLIETTRLLAGKPMTLHVTDKATGAVFQGVVLDEDPNPQAPNPDQRTIDPASVANMSNGAALTRDLFQFVKLPQSAAEYEVYLEFGEYESNHVVIAVRSHQSPRVY